ncbi:MAG TPA: WD40 repeat domain-containing protein [Vicinamibacterales bacterium]|nr:WD40 repeat domain-containing protein [Vicinamibacterales bacterium]
MPRFDLSIGVLLVLAGMHGWSGQTAVSGHTSEVRVVSFLADGRTLLSGAADYTIRLWDVPDGRSRGIWQRVPEFDAAASTTVISVSPAAGLIARAGAEQGTAEIWDIAKTARVRTIRAHARVVDAVALSRGGSLLVTATADEVRTWDVAAGKALARVTAPNLYRIGGIAAAPDGKTIAVAATDRTLVLYDAVSGKPLVQYQGVPGQVKSLDFSPDGKLLASGQEAPAEDSVRIWDVSQAAAVQHVAGPPNQASAVAFSPDGRLLASAERIVMVWDVEARTPTHSFTGHTAPVRSLAFSPDGALLASAADDRVIALWTIQK